MAHCQKQGLGQIVDIVLDDNQSGTSFERLAPIKAKVRNREVDVLLCKDASRLGRNILESLKFTEFLADHGVTLVFESEGYDADMFPLIAWFNERRAKEDSLKIRRVLRHKMVEGCLVIKAPYGYVKEGSRLVVDPACAPVVQQIFALFVHGQTMSAIAQHLNAKGIPTPSQRKPQYAGNKQARQWNRQHIARILNHPVYAGDMVYGQRERASFKTKKVLSKSKSDWLVHPNHHEAIVTREHFEKAQALLQRQKRTQPRKTTTNPFSGLLFCGKCQSRMVKIQRKNGNVLFVCGKSHREGALKNGSGCSPHRVALSSLQEVVLAFVQQLLSCSSMEAQVDHLLAQWPSPEQETAKQLQALDEKIAALQRKMSVLYDDKLNGTIPAFLFTEKLVLLEKDMALYTAKKEALEADSHGQDAPADKPTLAHIMGYLQEQGLDHDTLALLFQRILVFDPMELTTEHRQDYNLTDEHVYQTLYENGGLLFIQNFNYTAHAFTLESPKPNKPSQPPG